MLMMKLRDMVKALLNDGYHVSSYRRETYGYGDGRYCHYSFTFKEGKGNKTLTRLVKKFLADKTADLKDVNCDKYKNWGAAEGEPEFNEECRVTFAVPETSTLVTESEAIIENSDARLTCESFEESQTRYRAALKREAMDHLDDDDLQVRSVETSMTSYSMGRRVMITCFRPFEKDENPSGVTTSY